jgi:hypothetical protein
MLNIQHDLMAGRKLHQDQAIFTTGAALETATAAMILFHGRGAPAQDILQLAAYFPNRDMAYLAPQAAGNSWWPNRFMDPWLSISSRIPTSRCRFATADHLEQDRELHPAAGRAASGTRAGRFYRPRPQAQRRGRL